jgi:hypothetical protein
VRRLLATRAIALALFLLLFVPSVASANGLGIIRRSDSNGTIWGTRVDIGAPSQFNILSSNFGLMRIALQINPADPGLEQIGFGQWNGLGMDYCATSDPGQLKTYWEYKHSGYSATNSFYYGGYVCGIISNISGGDRTFNVHGYVASGNHCYDELLNGSTQNEDCSYSGDGVGCNCDSAYEAYIGGEIADQSQCNGNTSINGHYGTTQGSIPWQRTADQIGGTVNWNPVNAYSSTRDDGGQWNLNKADVPNPYMYFSTC